MSNTDTRIIVTERKNGSAYIKSAHWHASEADFVKAVQADAIRADGAMGIETAENACNFLDERHAQSTEILTRADFDAVDPTDWERVVLQQAEALGWWSEPGDLYVIQSPPSGSLRPDWEAIDNAEFDDEEAAIAAMRSLERECKWRGMRVVRIEGAFRDAAGRYSAEKTPVDVVLCGEPGEIDGADDE